MCILPVLVEPKLNPVAGAAAVVAAAPKPGAVRATMKKQTQEKGRQLNWHPDLITTTHITV